MIKSPPHLSTLLSTLTKWSKFTKNPVFFILCTSSFLVAPFTVGAENYDNQWPFHEIDADRSDKSERGADGIRLADVNGDGWTDAVSGWEQAGETRVYINPGREAIREPWPQVVVGQAPSPEDAVFADLDGDGNVDVVTSSEGPGGGIFIHWAPGPEDYMDENAWQTEELPVANINRSWMYTVPMDIDGKNGIDLVSGGKSTPLVWFESPEDPRDLEAWKMHVISEAAVEDAWTMNIIAKDMNGNGHQDIFWTTRKGGIGAVRWMENPGVDGDQTRPWTEHLISQENADFMFGDVADLDGDGRIDAGAGVNGEGFWLFRSLNDEATEWETMKFPVSGSVKYVKGLSFADINGDGQLDIVTTSERTRNPQWHEWVESPWSDAEDNWISHPLGEQSGKNDAPVVHDIDNDGDLDVLSTMEGTYNVYWFENPRSRGNGATVLQ